MERLEALQGYYSLGKEDGRLLSRRGSVEFLTTVHYIEKYLNPGMRILEIGAGTGRYSHYFARKGYAVDAIELINCNIEVFKANTLPEENITIRQGDAVDLKNTRSEQYDITLLLGPMYHLYEERDKIAALKEAIRVTKKGGMIFTAYCLNEATVIQFCFMKENIKKGISPELIDPNTFKLHSTPKEVFTLYRREEIDELMSNFDVTRLHYVGTDMITRYINECVDQMDDETFDLYLKYHFAVCERADCVGISNHALDIFKKN